MKSAIVAGGVRLFLYGFVLCLYRNVGSILAELVFSTAPASATTVGIIDSMKIRDKNSFRPRRRR